MPELPEVETVRRGLEPVMTGQVIAHAEVRRPDLRWPLPDKLAHRLTGRQILAMKRRSKYLLAELDGDETVILHLGMSGRILVAGAAKGVFYGATVLAGKHDHIILTLADGTRITFNDARRFGMVDLANTAEVEQHRLLANLGPEPLSNRFDAIYLAEKIGNRRTPIKSALLDQKIVAGLGNIYVCEVLFRAGIAPTRLCKDLTRAEIDLLPGLVREVLEEAIEAGGSSLRDHRQTTGELGYFQHRFQVYDRAGRPCLRGGCGGTVERIVQSGRSSFYCPKCQR